MALGSGDVPHLPRCRLGRITLRFLSFDHRYSVPHVSTLRRSTLCRGPGNLARSGFRVTTLRHSSANDHPSASNHFHRVAHSICGRSEEHTSELQSLAYLVCRLLLEKKKKK